MNTAVIRNNNNIGGECNDSKAIARDIRILREWIAKQPHLPQKHDDVFLESFLKGCELSLERCKEKLDKYYTVRATIPDIFGDRDPTADDMRDSVRRYAAFVLPGLMPGGHTLAFFRMLDLDVAAFDIVNLAKRISMSGDYFLRDNTNSQIVTIIDVEGLTWEHVIKVPLTLARDALHCIQDVYPVRLKEVIIIHPPRLIEVALKLFYPFMSDNLRNLITVREKLEDLYDTVPQHLLPEEYGGKAGTMEQLNDRWQKKLEDGRDWFLEESAKMVNESRRSGTCVKYSKANSVFGTGGSFRSLNLD